MYSFFPFVNSESTGSVKTKRLYLDLVEELISKKNHLCTCSANDIYSTLSKMCCTNTFIITVLKLACSKRVSVLIFFIAQKLYKFHPS